jgi:hypothetical protein
MNDVVLVLAEEKEVDDFEEAERIYDKQKEKPCLLMVTS